MRNNIFTALIAVFTIILCTIGAMPIAAASDTTTCTSFSAAIEVGEISSLKKAENEETGLDDIGKVYDLNHDHKVTVADLAIVKKYTLEKQVLSMRDYEMLKSYLLTGEWPYNLTYNSIDMDTQVYSEEFASFFCDISAGVTIDADIPSTMDELTLVTLYDTRVLTVHSSRYVEKEHISSHPFVITFNGLSDSFSFSLDEENKFYWDYWPYSVYPEYPYAPKEEEPDVNLSLMYDLNHDERLDVFDLILVQKEVANGKLTTNDWEVLKTFLLTGEWMTPITWEGPIDALDVYQNYEQKALDYLTEHTQGVPVEAHIYKDNEAYYGAGSIEIAYLYDVSIEFVCIGRCDQSHYLVLRLKDVVLPDGKSIVIGVSDDGYMCWDYFCEDLYPEIEM